MDESQNKTFDDILSDTKQQQLLADVATLVSIFS